MDAHTDVHLTRSDTSQVTLSEGVTLHYERELGNTSPNEDLVQDSPDLPPPDLHLDLATNRSDIEAHDERTPIHPFKSDKEPSDIQTERNMLIHEGRCTSPQSDSNHVIIPATTEEAIGKYLTSRFSNHLSSVQSQSEYAIVLLAGDNEATATLCPQVSLLLRTGTVSTDQSPRDEREVNQDDWLNYVQMPDHAQSAAITSTTDEVEAQEGLGHPCKAFLPSLPPSSSPPQLFSSSPLASSQSSGGDVELSEMVPAVGAGCHASPLDCTQYNHVVPIVQNDSGLGPGPLDGSDTSKAAISPKTNEDCLQTGPTSCIENGLELPRKRSTDHDGSYDLKAIKRSKLDSYLLLPPATKRASLASQDRQFQKLASPFRPPLKDGPVKIANNEVQSTTSTTLEASHNKVEQKVSTITFQRKGPNTPRSLTQFKSPLIDKGLPADSRTVRLTPALQTLERKLQLLKRAIKVKEESEEEVLGGLAEKWIEAGREAAYDVWGAIKDTGDFTGKVMFLRKSYGWENNNDRNTPWGWDTKQGDGEEYCNLSTADESCTTERRVSEEDDTSCHTLGTMLRQLGIDPGIFGWDEMFSD